MTLLRKPDQHRALLAVIGLFALGLGVVTWGPIRLGLAVMAGALWLAAALRVALPASSIGLLAVRSKRLDVLTTTSLALALSVLAIVLPVRAG